MISISIIGRVGKDADTKSVGKDRLVTSWPVAVNVGWGDNKKTEWFDCALWGERGEKLAEHIRKGDQIGVCGSLSTREHDGKTYLKIDVRDVTLIGGKPTEGEGRQQRAPANRQSGGDSARAYRERSEGGRQSAPPVDDFSDDDLPPF